LMFFIPESPRWLAKSGNDKKARDILARIGGERYAAAAIADIDATLVNDVETVKFHELLDPKMLKILMVGVTLAVLQQWCGINTIYYYAEEIFKSANYGVNESLLNIVGIGATSLAFTFVAIFTADRWGRKALMLAGLLGLAILYVLLGTCYYRHVTGTPILVMLLGAVGCYASTLAPITWVILSEIFPNRIRGAAMSISVFALWMACFILADAFPHLIGALGLAKTFWLYAGICLAGFVFVLCQLPETKGKTLEQIERDLVD
jgi:MFS transporter, SP family, arabinose:H+ symporter